MKLQKIQILLYHSILDDLADPYTVALGDFKTQMDYIARKGYNVISLEEVLNHPRYSVVSRKLIALTFDDGFVDFFENAAPILAKHNFKSTVFILASQVGNVSGWREQNLNRQLMDWGQIKQIVKTGHFIGSHGLRHCDLTKLSQKELDEEIVISKKIIQERLGIRVDSFSYPWGKCTSREFNSVRQAGYRCAVGVGRYRHSRLRPTPFLLERIPIEQKDSLNMFVKKIA